MDLLFVFYLLILLAGLTYSVLRLYQLRTAGNLSLAAIQTAVVTFLIFSYDGGVYREPFIVLISFAAGFFLPAAMLYLDVRRMRAKIKDRFGMGLLRFLYQNDRNEFVRDLDKSRYVDQIIKPRVDSAPVDEIMGEIRVERADTSKNILKQLESAAFKYDEGDFDGSYAAYQIIEKVFNRSPTLFLNIGNIFYDKGEFDAAARNYKRGTECAGHKDFEHDDMSGKLGALFYNLGNAYFVLKKYGKALDAYKNSVDAAPMNDDALFNLSFCHAMDFEDTGDTEKALGAFKKLADEMPDNQHAWLHYGKCLLKMKDLPQAIECFQRVVEEDIMFCEAWYRLAIAYDESGMVADAVKAYYTSIQIKPDFIDSYNNLGVLLSTIGRRGEALRVLKSGLRIKPGDAELIYNIGMTLYESDKPGEALSEFLLCARLRPDDGGVLYMISLIYMKLGKPQESAQYLKKAVHKDPEISARASKEGVLQGISIVSSD